MPTNNSEKLLEVKGLTTHFFTDEGVVKSVNGVDFSIERRKMLCVVGESGCGKSVTARSILQLIHKPGKIVSGEILWHRQNGETVDITKLGPRGREIRDIRGKEISMIFQEPMSTLSPVHTIGNQLLETIRLHLPLNKQQATERAIYMLERVGIPKAASRLDNYAFELSGGMRQRVMIALALCCESSLLIADEPTTALDVTTQATILDLIAELQEDLGMAVMFITHDLGVVAEIADEVVVMYLGQVVERGPVDAIFHDPKHPYLQSLLCSIPQLSDEKQERLSSIRGMIPHPFDRPKGCQFNPRCDRMIPGLCDQREPVSEQLAPERDVRCWLYSNHK